MLSSPASSSFRTALGVWTRRIVAAVLLAVVLGLAIFLALTVFFAVAIFALVVFAGFAVWRLVRHLRARFFGRSDDPDGGEPPVLDARRGAHGWSVDTIS